MLATIEILTEEVVSGNQEKVKELVRQALDEGEEPKEVLAALTRGIDKIGEKWSRFEVFIPDVMLASEAMKTGLALVEPLLKEEDGWTALGTVVLGTVKGDLHDIGKNIVGTMLTSSGFEVHDIGIDKPATVFINKARETNANIIAVSALLTTTMQGQKDIIELLTNMGERERFKVIIGGGPVTQEWADSIGADGFGETAVDAVKLAKGLMN